MRALAKFASVAALATASISSANAAVYVFNYAGNSNSNSYGTPGNTITSTASNGSTSVSVTASAWSTVSNVTSAAWLGNYPEGLGVKNAAADQNSVDNYAGLDYVLLQFSRPPAVHAAQVDLQELLTRLDWDADVRFLPGQMIVNVDPVPFRQALLALAQEAQPNLAAGQRLQGELGRRAIPPRTIQAEIGDRRDDQVRIARP